MSCRITCAQGDWVDGKMEGMGTYQYADGSRYTGPWKDSKMHGR